MTRPRPWRPKGNGFRRIFDSGQSACWMRREPDGVITCVVYIGPTWGKPYEGIWTLSCEPGAPILHNIYDKPHRVSWVERADAGNWHGGTLISKRPIPQGPLRRAPKTRNGRRRNVRESRKNWLPRKFAGSRHA